MLKWFFRNLRTLILALALSIAVWVTAVTAADPNEIRTYPRTLALEVIGQDPSLVLIGTAPPKQVALTLRAPRSVWDKLTASDGHVRAVVDLSGLGPGQHTIPVQIQITEQPSRIISISPVNITIGLEALATRTLPVEFSPVGEPAVGFKAGNPQLTPKEVTISGPESLVNRASVIEVVVESKGAREDIEIEVQPQIKDDKNVIISGLSITPGKVQVKLPVTQQGGYRDIAVKVVVRGQVASGYRLTNISVLPPVVTVYASNPALVNELPGFVETEPLNLDVASQNIETHLSLILPENISLVGEQTVQVLVGIAAIEGSLSLNNLNVEIVGLGEGLKADISPLNVDLILSGPLPLLDKLSATDVKILVDLTDLAEGVHQIVPITQILIDDIRVQAINPGTIEVTISPGVTPQP